MQKGVRAWYFGAAGSSNAEEAYLLGTVSGASVQVTHHSAVNNWLSPNPPSTATYPVNDKGPFWIHPLVLQNLKLGDLWMGQEITLVNRSTYTYGSFLDELPARNHFLPIKALFDLTAQRQVIKILYMIPNASTGAAYFDAETGLLLYYNNTSGFVSIFFILSEINYDFGRKQAFAEDDGPHSGFKSIALEDSITPVSYVLIQSLVETRYGKTVELRVQASLAGSSTASEDKNYCFFGDIPILRRIDASDAADIPPEQWYPFGMYLFWWVPPADLTNSTINIYDASMDRTAVQPITYTSTETPQHFHFTNLVFGSDGYMTSFFAKDPTIGLDLNTIYENKNTVNGLDYYRNVMGIAKPDVTVRVNKVNPALNFLLLE